MSTNIFNPADQRQYPSRWPLYRGKHLFRVIDERSESGREDLLSVSHITGITPRSQKNVTMFKSESLVGYKLCQIGDIAANTMWTWQGAIGVSKYTGVVSPAYNVYRQKDNYYNPEYLDMLLREYHLVDVYHSLSTGIRPSRLRLYPDVFLTIDFPVPPRTEQDQIVRFLDWNVSEINKLIGIRRKEIQELEELRSSVIKTTVTSGLDSAASRKYSGESWIGEIPEKWQTLPIKRLFKIYSGATPKSGVRRYWDGDVIWITPADFKTKDKYVTKGAKTLTDEGFASCSTSIVPAGSIIFSKRAPVGSVVINSNPLCTNQGCLSCVPYSNASSEFFYYVMSICTDEFERRASGTTFKEISLTEFGKFQMPVPPVDEQKTLASFLYDECSRIGKVISIDEEKIAGLKELKNTIVSDVVTGKIDVRDIAVPEYEHFDDIADDDAEDSEEDTGETAEEV